MKKSKILIILGIIVAIVIIVVVVVIKMQNEKISYDKEIYYEYAGSSSVNRKSTIYSDNDKWIIVTEYFNSGRKLNDDDKKKILDKINENSSASTSDNLDHESDDILERKVGGTMFYAMEYINSDEGKEITPVNLEELNMVKNVFDVNV